MGTRGMLGEKKNTVSPDFGSEHVIEVDGLSFGYGGEGYTIEDVSFSIDRPEFVCVVGPNGVGKSTLIKCINGILKPSKGEVRVYGADVQEYELRDLAKIIGYVPVMTSDFNVMTVLEAVMIGRYAHQSWKTNPEDVAISQKALDAMEMGGYAMHRFSELSAGQHQKASIARGLVQQPRILILDEPTSNLDIRHQIYVSAFLKKLSSAAGMTVVMISHDLNLAAKYADEIVLLEPPGRIRAMGPPSEVLTEETIQDVYKVHCRIIDDAGTPHIILGNVI